MRALQLDIIDSSGRNINITHDPKLGEKDSLKTAGLDSAVAQSGN